jgi:hypothetical protein
VHIGEIAGVERVTIVHIQRKPPASIRPD